MINIPPLVAICQPNIILGGRLSVIIGMVKILNELGIIPDIVTTKLNFDPADIETKYGKMIQVKYRYVPPHPVMRRGEWRTIGFNASLKKYAPDYDLMINTSNSLAFLPKNHKVLTYMFYPRKSRIDAVEADIHMPELPLQPYSKRGINRRILRQVYKQVSPYNNHGIVAMTQFTKQALTNAYNHLSIDIPIIYPAVDMQAFWSDNTIRQPMIVTAGRFSLDKQQLAQIKIAKQLPDFQFHIFGFTGAGHYFSQCEQYVKLHHLNNIHLHPNAPFTEMLAHLQQAKYFLHTLIKEPFGLTAVQAMAAGCIPIVHNSGGQVETVPLNQLRYNEFNQIPDYLAKLEALSEDKINIMRTNLQTHIKKNFTESIFHKKMKTILVDYLNI